MNKFALFTDVSLNPQHKSGIGGYLLLPHSFLEIEPHMLEQADLSARIKFKRFTETSSTKLEVQTVLWGVESSREELAASPSAKLMIYTDSQCVAGLLSRRTGLTRNNFVAKGSGRQLSNALLYRQFYEIYDQVGFQVTKMAGHSRAAFHDTIHRIFSYVDRDVRQALAAWVDLQQSAADDNGVESC